MARRSLLVSLVLSAAGFLVPVPAASQPSVQAAATTADFNGDGIADLAIGAPFDHIGDAPQSAMGSVTVLYGTAAGGLSTAIDPDLLLQGGRLGPDTQEYLDQFGDAVAWGDFNADGFSDLAVGVPGEDVGTTEDAGALNVFYGSTAGITRAGNQVFTQANVKGTVEAEDQFSTSLATADFDGDGFDDVAVGAPFEDLEVAGAKGAGAVTVIFGSATGLVVGGNEFWSQAAFGIPGGAEEFDSFGRALAGGDFNLDGRDDLAAGVPGEDVGNEEDAGAVNVIYGSSTGLTSSASQLWTQDSDGIEGAVQDNDAFGSSIAAGNLGRTGHADLAIGIPREDRITVPDAGAVNVIYGSSARLTSSGDQLWGAEGAVTGSDDQDQFGDALAIGDLSGDGVGDLAVGVPRQRVVDFASEGVVEVIYGTPDGLTGSGRQRWSQLTSDIEGQPAAQDHFGQALAAANFGRSPQADLAIGVPNDGGGSGSDPDFGAVNVLYGTTSGLTSANDQLWHQDVPGVPEERESLDEFGVALAQRASRSSPAITCRGRAATIVGGGGSERIRGTPRADVIVAGPGDDDVVGLRGNDVLCGGRGADLLAGGRGHDALVGGPGADTLIGGPGTDTLLGGPGKDVEQQ